MNFKTRSNDRYATPSIPQFSYTKNPRKYTSLNHSLPTRPVDLGIPVALSRSHLEGGCLCIFALIFFFLFADSRLIPLAAFSHHYLSESVLGFPVIKTLSFIVVLSLLEVCFYVLFVFFAFVLVVFLRVRARLS